MTHQEVARRNAQVRAAYAAGASRAAIAEAFGMTVKRVSEAASERTRKARRASIALRDAEIIDRILRGETCVHSSAAISHGVAPGSPADPLSTSQDA